MIAQFFKNFALRGTGALLCQCSIGQPTQARIKAMSAQLRVPGQRMTVWCGRTNDPANVTLRDFSFDAIACLTPTMVNSPRPDALTGTDPLI